MRTRQAARRPAKGCGWLGVGEGGEVAIVVRWRGGGRWGVALDEFEGECRTALNEFEGLRGDAGSGAMFDGQGEAVAGIAAQVEVGVAPGVEFGRTAQGLAGAHVAGALAGMVDEDDGEAVAALQLAQVSEQRGDFAADIFVDAMQPDEGIEDEEPRFQAGDGFCQAAAIGLEIEAETGGGDHLQVEVGEIDAGGGTNSVEATANDVQGVLGGIEEDAAGLGDGEAAQAGRAGGDGDGQVEGKEGFAALRFTADVADGFLGPQCGDQPALFVESVVLSVGGFYREFILRRLPPAALASTGRV